MADAGRRLIAALKEAIEGDFARVTINGVTWVRRDAPEPPPEAFAQAQLEAWNEAVEACAQGSEALTAISFAGTVGSPESEYVHGKIDGLNQAAAACRALKRDSP